MNDDYKHVNNKIIYIVENIPGPKEASEEYEEICNNFNSQLTDHCNCCETCSFPTCVCLKNSNRQCSDSCTINGEYDESVENPILECNSLCSCSHECVNRLVQNGPINGLTIKTCSLEGKGLGLFTKVLIPKGSFICEYAGEILTRSQALRRQEINKMHNLMNYIYCLNEHCNGSVTQTFIDPSNFGNIGRYMNHSCEPNCLIIPVRVDIPIPKLAIFSCADIQPNEELTFNYGSCIKVPDSYKGQIPNENRKNCLCGSEKCKGFMPFDVY